MSTRSAEPTWSLRDATRPGIQAVRDHLRPFLLIQGCAAALVVGYYQSERLREAATTMAEWKTAGGWLFAVLTTAFAGVVLPEVFKFLTRDPNRFGVRQLLFNACVFGFIGLTVDLFYQLLAATLGNSSSFGVVVAKVLLDQLVYSPFVSIPLSLFLFQWRDLGFDFKTTVATMRVDFLRRRLLPAVIVCWAFWGPVVSCIYVLPANLQFCLFLFAEAAWSLLLIHVSKSQGVSK